MSASSLESTARGAGRYYIESWGCQMNVLDADKMSGALERHGYVRTDCAESADVVLLNTCSIREKAKEKVFSELGRLKPIKDLRPDVVLGVCGCVAQQEGEEIFSRAPYVDIVVGTRATRSLPILVDRLRAGDETARHSVDIELRDDSIHFPFDQIRREITRPQGVRHVIEGAITVHLASFRRRRTRGRAPWTTCSTKFGRSRLAACAVGSSGKRSTPTRTGRKHVGELLVATAGRRGRRIRFTTSHPAQMTNGLIDAMAAARPKLCSYLHLPVQSGSSRVLSEMRRGYDRDGYLAKIRGLRARIPELCLGTDVIVGFPTETEEDFQETVSLVEAAGFDDAYTFKFSPREGTPAVRLKDTVPDDVAAERLDRLIAVVRGVARARNAALVGTTHEVLVEGPAKRGDLLQSRTRKPRAHRGTGGEVGRPGRSGDRILFAAKSSRGLTIQPAL
jgi:tRNA-2-methylthio-N6-dimethylallyladenosine synthase